MPQYCLAQVKFDLPACQEVSYQCPACKTDYRHGFDMDMEPIEPNYPLPAIPLNVEYVPWMCSHGNVHTAIVVTEVMHHAIHDPVNGYWSGWMQRTVRVW